MRHFLSFIVFLLLLSFTGCSKGHTDEAAGTDSIPRLENRNDSMKKLISTVKRCSRLYTSEFLVHKIVTHDDELKLKGSILGMDYNIGLPAGSRRIAIPIDGKLKGFIDFSQFSEDNVIFDGNRIELILPDPQVELTSTKINHNEVKSYVALLRSNFSDKELSTYEARGRKRIIESIPELKIADRTKASASRILVPLIQQLGFNAEDIVITFRKDFDENHLQVFTD